MFILDSLQMILYEDISFFPEYDFEFTHVSGFDPLDQIFYFLAVPVSTEQEPKPDDAYLWSDEPSDELLYEAAA